MKNNYTPLILSLLMVLLISSAGCIRIAENTLGGEKSGIADNVTTSPNIPPVLQQPHRKVSSHLFPITFQLQKLQILLWSFHLNRPPIPIRLFMEYGSMQRPSTVSSRARRNLPRPTPWAVMRWGSWSMSFMDRCISNIPLTRSTTVSTILEKTAGEQYLVPVNRPYMTITVLDNQTQQIVAEDGYAREYSSDTGNYQYTNTVASSDSTEAGTYTSEPEPRYISVLPGRPVPDHNGWGLSRCDYLNYHRRITRNKSHCRGADNAVRILALSG